MHFDVVSNNRGINYKVEVSPQLFDIFQSRVTETGAHLAHSASELKLKSRTYRLDHEKNWGNEVKMLIEKRKYQS